MMDVPQYAKSAADKIMLYTQNRIYPDEKLITTYETKEQPIDTGKIQKLIAYYFGEDS